MEEPGGGFISGTGNRQLLDPSALPQVHSGLSASSDTTNNNGVRKTMVPPSYEEALASPRQIIIQDSYISAVYAPPYPPAYSCDHHPSGECSFCVTPRRRSLDSRRGHRPRRYFSRTHRSWPKILLFSFMFMFFLVMTSVLYNILLVEPFFYPDWCPPPSCTSTTPTPN